MSSLAKVALLLAACAAGQPAWAKWPEKQVKIIVPFPAGGIVDAVARQFAQVLSSQIDKPVYVVNRDGGAGIIGTAAVAASTDAHTLGFVPNGPLVVQPLLSRKLTYDTGAFKPLCQIFSYSYVLATRQESAITSGKEFLQAVQTASKPMGVAMAGIGTVQHFVILEMAKAASPGKLLPVPYRGDPPVALALKSGEVESAVLSVEVARPQNFRVLAVTSDSRYPGYPEVPTLKELGIDIVAKTYAGLVAPSGMPAEALQTLDSACTAVAKKSEFQAALKKMSVQADFLAREPFEAAVRADIEAKKRLIVNSGIKID